MSFRFRAVKWAIEVAASVLTPRQATPSGLPVDVASGLVSPEHIKVGARSNQLLTPPSDTPDPKTVLERQSPSPKDWGDSK